MTPAQQSALEAIVGRPLPASEIALANIRNDTALAESLSVGRTRPQERLISERGILAALGPVDGEAFLAALESIASAADLPEAAQPYFGAIRRGAAWLKGDGIDIGSETTHSLLDLLVTVGKVSTASVATLKTLGQVSNPLTTDAVSAILNSEG